MLTLVIGNKCYSSWSLRPWLALRHHGIDFQEVLVPLDRADTKETILKHSPAGKVPVLKDEGVTVWESLAILDYLGDRFPECMLWPEDRAARAMARSVSAEMHAGFMALRRAMPMNLARRFADTDRGEDVARDIERVLRIWKDARKQFGQGGDFLFGQFGAADAMFAPVVTRFHTYSVPVDDEVRRYMGAVMALPAFQAWRKAALEEEWVLDHDEVDEPAIENLRPNLK